MHKLISSRVKAGLAIFIVTLLGVTFAQADGPLSWSWGSQIYVNKVANVSESDIPSTFFSGGNIDCTATQDTHCSVNTPYGSIYDSSIWINGKWRPIADYGNNRANFYAVPISDTSMTASNSPVFGSYIYFTDNTSTSLTPSYILGIPDVNLGGEDRLLDHFQLNHPPDRKLADKTGTSLSADLSSMGFSGNSHWMVVTDPDIATLRVDIKSGEVLPFGRVFTYGNGLNPKPKNAISSDGRYAVVASQDASTFTIYDLSTCNSVPESISRPVNCQSRELINSGFIPSQIHGYSGIRNIRFLDDDTLSFYASYTEGVTTKFAQYTLSASSGPVSKLQYLALGDSYISGEGAFHYLDGTDTSDSQCHVSLLSFPLLLGQDLGYNSYRSAACSGARTNDITDISEQYKGQVKPFQTRQKLEEENRISPILSNFQQGYIDQLDFVRHYQPKVITVSIGGNDIAFSAKLRGCIDKGTCYSTYEERLEFVREINRSFPDLVNTYTKIKNAGRADDLIYAIGYPQIANTYGDCGLNVHMNLDELVFAEQAIRYLDAVISQAAAKAGVFYVDTQDAFFGHRLCESGPDSVAMNGISAGNDFPDKLGGPIGRESYHPNAYGHQLLERTIIMATHNLNDTMPQADYTAAPPAELGQEILNAPHSGRAVNLTEFDPGITTDLAYQQTPIDISISGVEHSLPPNSTLQAEIHSTPLNIGTYSTDNIGDLSAQIIIPASVAAGYHSVHFYGTDIAGQPIDIYKVIYLASTADDLDGNGITDSAQACVGVAPSGRDFDQDGIDDACDGDITQPPVVTSANIAGTISSKTNQLDIITEPKATSSPSNISTASISISTHSNTGHVLSDNIVSNPQKPTFKTAETIRVPAKYYFGSGIGFLALVLIAYAAKSWL